MKRIIWIVLLAVIGFFVGTWVMAIVPPNPDRSHSRKVTGKIEMLTANPSTLDISFFLDNDKRHYRINRGMEKVLTKKYLDSLTAGKQAEIYYYTLLPSVYRNMMDESYPHVCELSVDGKVIYTEYN